MPASSASVHLYPIPPSIPQPGLPTGLKIVSGSTQTRASNAARAALVVANVTPTGYRVGLFMANHARYATAADVRRNVSPGEIFTYWSQAKIAAEIGCSERQVRRGVRSMREAGALEVRRRVRPCEASYVWVQPVLSGVRSGVRSHTEPRTEPQNNHVGSSRARVVCEVCGNSWPNKPEYGTECYKCRHKPSTGTPADDKPPDEPTVCTCGDAYRNSYQRRCVDCEGTPSFAQMDALKEAMSKGKECGHLGNPEKPRRRDGTEKAGVLRAASHLHQAREAAATPVEKRGVPFP